MALFIKKRPLGWCQKGSPSVDGNGQTSLSVSNCVKLCQESHIDSFLTQFLRILESVDWLHRNRHISDTFSEILTHDLTLNLHIFTWFLMSIDWLHKNWLIPYTFFQILGVSWLMTQKSTHFLHISENLGPHLTNSKGVKMCNVSTKLLTLRRDTGDTSVAIVSNFHTWSLTIT